MGERDGSCEGLVTVNDVINDSCGTDLYLNHDHPKQKDVRFHSDGRTPFQDLRCGQPYGRYLSGGYGRLQVRGGDAEVKAGNTRVTIVVDQDVLLSSVSRLG